MSKGWWVWTLACGAFFLNPIVVAQTRDQREDRPAVIEGYVVQTGSGEPLDKARVILRPERGRSPVFGAVTDSSGRFTLWNIESGNYRLFVERDGYVDLQYGQLSPNRPGTVLVLVPGQQVQNVVMQMVPTGVIAGRIYDEDGDPMVAAAVRAMRFDYQDGERVLRVVSQAETNDLGEYRLYWLAPGEYYVSGRFDTGSRRAARFRESLAAARPIGAGGGFGGGGRSPSFGEVGRGGSALDPATNQTAETYVDTYYPGTVDPLTATQIAVQPGAEIRGADFVVLPVRAVSISGEVVSALSEEEGFVTTVAIVPRNSLMADRRSNRRGGPGNRAENGRFELTNVAPGDYTIVAIVRSGPGRGGGQVLTGLLDIEVGAQDIDGLRIPVQPGVSIEGQVLVDQSASDIDVSRLRVRLELDGNIPIGSPSTRVEGDGTFVIHNVSPLTYRALVTGLPEGAYLAAGRAGARDILREGIQVVGGVGPIEFHVSGAGGSVDGTIQVSPDQTFTGAEVVLIPNNPARTDLYKVRSADQYGRVSIGGIAPGKYEIFAWEDAPSGAYQDPEFVRRYRDLGEPVEIDQGTEVSVKLRLIPAGS